MADDSNVKQNGWNEYSKLVIKELQTLSDGIDNLSTEVAEIKRDIVQIKSGEDRVSKLEKWKEKSDEVATPTQTKELLNQIEDYKRFKTQATTIFAVVQFLMAVAMFVMRFVGL